MTGAILDPTANMLAPDVPLRAAMDAMSRTGVNVIVVADADGVLRGVVVDSDIRRALLDRPDLDQPIEALMTRTPRTVDCGLDLDALRDELEDCQHPYLPMIDEGRVVRGLLHVWALFKEQALPNAAVVMAGGEGQRLRPITENVPKPLIEVGGQPIIDRILGNLRKHGIARAYITVRYLSQSIRAHLGDGAAHDMELIYLEEEEPLGTAGVLAELAEREREPVLVTNGDILTSLNPQSLLAFHAAEGGKATIALRPLTVSVPYGVVEMAEGRFTGIREKPSYTYQVSAGINVFDPDCFRLIGAGEAIDVPDLLGRVETAHPGGIACFPVSEYWIDVGRMADLERARREIGEVFE